MVSGGTLTVGLRSVAHARVTALLQVVATRVRVTGKGKQRKRVTHTSVLYHVSLHVVGGAHGQFTASGRISYKPSKPMPAILLVTGRAACGTARRGINLTITPRQQRHPVISLRQRDVVSGGTLAVGVHTEPGAGITITVQVLGTHVIMLGKGTQRKRVARTAVLYRATAEGKANARGLLNGRVRVTYKPAKPVRALVTVTARTAHDVSTSSVQATILPRR